MHTVPAQTGLRFLLRTFAWKGRLVVDGDVARCPQPPLLSSDSHPLTSKHSGKFSGPHSDTSSLRPSTTVCCSERPTPTAASHLVVPLQPLELSFCRTHEAERFARIAGDLSRWFGALLCPASAFSTLISGHFWKAALSRLPEAPPSLLPPQLSPLPLSVSACGRSGALFPGPLLCPQSSSQEMPQLPTLVPGTSCSHKSTEPSPTLAQLSPSKV